MPSSKNKLKSGPGQRIHYFQHVPFEDLAAIENWVRSHHHVVSRTAFYQQEPLPDLKSIDWLIIMGGPMSIHDQEKYPWLKEEKKFIRQAIDRGKKVLGICLGAQLIADALGGKVTQNRQKEIGWHIIESTPHKILSKVFSEFPETLNTFHWHGETFSIPRETIHSFSTPACKNQAFEYEGRVIGLQFHLEMTPEGIQRLIQNCPEDLTPGPFVQTPKEMLSQIRNLPINHLVLYQLLDRLEAYTKA